MAKNPDDWTELRGEIPRPLADLIDALVLARGGRAKSVDRMTVVNEVLLKWGRQVAHESMIVHRVTGGNPAGLDSSWLRQE